MTTEAPEIVIPSPDDDWARVELWRWQYGDLPQPDDFRPLDESAGLMAMSKAIENGCKSGVCDRIWR